MKILAIESSCDETAAAVVEDGRRILSNVVVSQVDIFKEYGGVIPEVAARSHLEAILPVVHKALKDAALTKDDVDCIAVTHTPGLLGSLLIGTLTARTLAILWRKPLYAVHHLKSHIYANWLTITNQGMSCGPSGPAPGRSDQVSMVRQDPAHSLICDNEPAFPLVSLVVSGGHTQLIYMRDHNQFEIIGTTRDDAVGECFDKVAKILGLPYPGGPSIARAALSSAITALETATAPSLGARPRSVRCSSLPCTSSKISAARTFFKEHPNYRLPHPQVEGLDFSFSGLKTAVLRAVQAELGVPISTPSYTLAEKLTEQQRADFAAAFQETACDILVEKLKMALRAHTDAKSVVVAGGVSANAVLRKKLSDELLGASNAKLAKNGGSELGDLGLFFPDLKFAGDNAAMVGAAAYFEIQAGVAPTDPYALNIAPRQEIR